MISQAITDGQLVLLLTPRQAALALSVSERTVAAMTAKGELPSIKLGKSRRYLLDDLRAFCAAKKME